MVHEQKFKDLLSSRCRKEGVGPGIRGSILTGVTFYYWIFFVFHVVKTLMSTLALLPTLCIMGKLDGDKSPFFA